MPAAPDIADREATAAGRLVVILGPSGAGKDTLLSIAAGRLRDRDDIRFVRRAITRPAHGDSEDFCPMTPEAFATALAAGDFCFHWAANGLRYGLPKSLVDDLAAGRTVVLNGSRAAHADLRRSFGSVLTVEISVDPAVLEKRLRTRGRETDMEIARRIERASAYHSTIEPDIVIDNSGSAEEAGARFAAIIGAAARQGVGSPA